MILKYEEYIKEGLWSKGIERSKSDVDRLEHKLTQSYVEDIFNPKNIILLGEKINYMM